MLLDNINVMSITNKPPSTLYSNMEKISDESDMWGWNGELVPVPGFGFFPRLVQEDLYTMTQDVANMSDLDMSNLSLATIDHLKCTILNETWRMYFPQLASQDPQGVCGPLWDQASCVPPTLSGSVATFPCMTMYDNKYFNTQDNASRLCYSNGTWAPLTNYTECIEVCLENQSWINGECLEYEVPDISLYIYFVGYSISLFALLLALSMFLSFRELRCLRHKIHMGLFLTVILADLSWIFTAMIQSLISHTDYFEIVINIWCVSQVILRYFHLTTFFWMFIEGLYLFLQVQLPLSLASIKHVHFLVIGWGFPLINMIVWSLLRVYHPSYSSNISSKHMDERLRSMNKQDKEVMNQVMACPFMQESDTDLYGYKLPVFLLLLANTFFLVWIMVIVVSKMHAHIAKDHDRRHWKAAKALVIIIPLLGCTYLLTLVGPRKEDTLIGYMIFEALRAALLSMQGAVVTLPYCFLNTEVQGVMKNHWTRWKMVRNVGYECQSARTSVAHSTTYYTQVTGSVNKLKLMTTKVDASFLSVPSGQESICSRTVSRASSRSVSFSEICQPLTPQEKDTV